LCGGFPCQPFSKAGKQLGRDDDRGTLFDEIVKILEFRKPTFFILENVPFIAKHDNEATWEAMQSELDRIGYQVDHNIYSPQDFGIPQHRKRIFIVGSRIGLDHFSFDEVDKSKTNKIDIHKFIEVEPTDAKKLPKANQDCIKLWQEFISSIPKDVKLPGFPIWGMEFGATYPFEDEFPHLLSANELSKYKGNFGISLKGMTKEEQFANLPSYARVETEFPDWKQRYIKYNRQFYKENKSYVEDVVKRISELPSQSWQKLEWNVGDNKRKITNYILQFRASGNTNKKGRFFPFIGLYQYTNSNHWLGKRYITKKEGLKLQSLTGIKLPESEGAAFKALGNAVNSHIVELIAKQLIMDPSDLSKEKGNKI
jgi:DNA (cytosine-5)-methyltransferase 1